MWHDFLHLGIDVNNIESRRRIKSVLRVAAQTTIILLTARVEDDEKVIDYQHIYLENKPKGPVIIEVIVKRHHEWTYYRSPNSKRIFNIRLD